MQSVQPLQLAGAIRALSLDAVQRVGEGHPGAPLGCAEIVTTLFRAHLKFNSACPEWFDRDRFVLSNGHASMLLYSVLHLTGYAKIGLDELKRFRELGSRCPGHPEYEPGAGVETTTGALGQGIANAVGMALAEAFLNDRYGADLVDHRTYALVGDGCLQEGLGQEVMSLAGHMRLGKLCFLWDDNRITDDGSRALSDSDDMPARFRACAWHVQEVDGHDEAAVSAALEAASADPRPSMIACRTIIGRGFTRLQGERGAHSGRVLDSDRVAARAALGWPHEPFVLPDDVIEAWRRVGRRGIDQHRSWRERVAGLDPVRRREFERVCSGERPDGWREALQAFGREALAQPAPRPGIATAAEIVDRLAACIPELLAGAPDLEGSTQHKRQRTAFSFEKRSGRYVHYGVREHAMGAIMNGMAAHGGILPVGATYLAFSDYERPALRMAALMGLPVQFVFSHDSIGIGRNGPTHQPVEVLASLRALPNMLVFRPADAVEAAECWEIAIGHRSGPSALVFARQELHPARLTASDANLCRRGAYVLAPARGGERRVTLLATGSEVALALGARDRLQADGVPTAVVSMPCWSLFEAQSPDYRAEVLGRHTVRVGVEAAVRLGWDRYIGEDGDFIGMSGFGASGEREDLFAHFGITVDAIVETVRRRLPAERRRPSGLRAPAAAVHRAVGA